MTHFSNFRGVVEPPVTLGNEGFGEARIMPFPSARCGATGSPASLFRRVEEQHVRADCLTRIHARHAFRTVSGDLVRVDRLGLRHGLAPDHACETCFRTVIRFETTAPELDPLNRSLFWSVDNGWRTTFF